jgi:HEAT repeat protein
MSSLMVVVKFQRFMQRAASHMKALHFPLYVTAHDFDFIAVFDPRPESSRIPVCKTSVEELITDLIVKLDGEDPHTRFRAVTNLYGIGPRAKRALASLIERLNDPHLPTRQFAATALAKIDPASDLVVSALVANLKEDQPSNVRQEIVRALGSSRTKKATEALANALFDDDPLVRRYSVISLKVLGRDAKDAAPALQKLMETETDEEIRSQATVAIDRMRE